MSPLTAEHTADDPEQRHTELERVVSLVLETARSLGADAAEASASIGDGLSANVRMGEVDSLEFNRDRGMALTVYRGDRKGSTSTGDLSEAAVKAAVEKAVSIAGYTAEDPCSGLADAELMATDIPDLDLHHPWSLTPEAAIELAREIEDAARATDERITNSEGATVATGRGVRIYGNSHGFVGGYPSSSHSLSCSVIACQGDDMERDYHWTSARAREWLEDPAAVGREAARRAVQRLGARKLDTRRCPVVFPPNLARGFIGHLANALKGGAQYRRSSFLLDSVGRQVLPDGVDLIERPRLPGAMASAPFDDEGVATADSPLVEDGSIKRYILSSYSARKLGLTSTGNAGGLRNLVVTADAEDMDELIARMGTGFLLTELIGHGVNPVTGDYSRGAAGFWVEDGEIAFPVSEVTLAGRLEDLYRNVAGIGNDRDLRGGIRCGSILVEEMTLAGD